MRDVMLIVHFIGLAMGVGTSFAFIFLGISSSKMDKTERLKFQKSTFILSRMGHIGLGLLVLSGGYLMTPYWSILFTNHILLTKLTLVVVLIVLISLISIQSKKAINSNTEYSDGKGSLLGKITMFVSVLIVIMAVLTFH